MKIDFGKILKIASVVGPIVDRVQKDLRGKSGAEKKAVVVETVREDLLPVVELVAGKDLANDDLFAQLMDRVIETEVAAMKARAALDAFLDDVKVRAAAERAGL